MTHPASAFADDDRRVAGLLHVAVLLFSLLTHSIPWLAGIAVGGMGLFLASELPLARSHARAILCFHVLLLGAGAALTTLAVGVGWWHSASWGLGVFLAGACALGGSWLVLTLMATRAAFAGRKAWLPTLPEGLD